MNFQESNIQIPTSLEIVPALVLEPQNSSKGIILIYPGLGGEKEVQRKEMNWLAEDGFTAVCIDPPHHGERDDGYLEALAPLPDSKAHPGFIRIIQEAIWEIPSIVDFCLMRFQQNVGITGISLGGFITYGAVVCEPRLKAAIPILGSPDWSPKKPSNDSEFLKMIKSAPVHSPRKFPPCALFAANAGRDVSVRPDASRKFVAQLRQFYEPFPEKLKYVEYSESEHMMREGDWYDLWRQVLEWFNTFLK
jgi:uncharacterized protein